MSHVTTVEGRMGRYGGAWSWSCTCGTSNRGYRSKGRAELAAHKHESTMSESRGGHVMSDPTDIKLVTETQDSGIVFRQTAARPGHKWCQAIVYVYHGQKTNGAGCQFYALEGSQFCKRHQNYKGKLNGRTD